MKPRKIRWWVGGRGAKLQLCLFGLLLASASGCAKAQANTPTVGPPLAVPDAPERVIVPAEEPLPVVAAVPEPPPTVAPRPPARPPVRRPNTTDSESRPEPVTPPAAPSVPAPALRAAPSAADAAAERGVRDTLTSAGRDLGRVDYGRLSAEGRVQYEQSKRFTDQAEQALKDRNFPFAATLADKAAILATELLGSR